MMKVYMQEACPWRVSENDFRGGVWFPKPMVSFVQEFVCLCTRREVDGLRLGITYVKIAIGIVRWHTLCRSSNVCSAGATFSSLFSDLGSIKARVGIEDNPIS